MSWARARTWRSRPSRTACCAAVSAGSGPRNTGPGIFTVRSQTIRKTSGRKATSAIMRILPQRERGTMARRIGVRYLPKRTPSCGAPMAVRRLLVAALLLLPLPLAAQRTQKPALHGRHWIAITGKPLAATAGAMMFQKGGNPVDAACAMLAATSTMWDVLSWGGETQALIYNPRTKKVIAINALGVAPTGATAEYYKSKGYDFPPEYGPLAAVTPGTVGGLCLMLANYGTMSLKDVLRPAMDLAAGYPIDAQTANSMESERNKRWLKQWPYSTAVFYPRLGGKREAPEPGEIFVQKDLLETLTKMVEAEQNALKKKKSRKDAIMAA